MAGACQRIPQARLSFGLVEREAGSFFEVAGQNAAFEQRNIRIALPDADIEQASAKQGHGW
ncbi:hypothetical protein [Variovorax sp. Sphag1AA]|uniref:hypothetical protein n=1 Tax=Variovorax sp. Sphag1AA TaxID=2587027 RepID=UPI00161C325E|nr:hypothetical protein [Variovorax sp. Sphag1AA]MBB3176684.1 hypothetical protein [Variovorax sp. Sphag1AA]